MNEGDSVRKTGVAVIGAGRISEAHLKSIQNLSDRIDLVAIVDVDEKAAHDKAEAFQARAYYTKLSDALVDRRVDAFVICVPHYLHSTIACEVLKSGKHVLIEKPLALSVGEADIMIKAAEQSNVVLMVAQSRRFYKAVLDSKKLLPQIGLPFNVTATWNVHVSEPPALWWRDPKKVGEGLVVDLNGAHLLDYVLWIIDSKPSEVYAISYQNNSTWKGPDEALIAVKFEDGRFASTHLSFNTIPEINEKVIQGKNGTIVVKRDQEILLNGELVITHEEQMDYLKGGENFVRQMDEFIDAIVYEKTPLTSAKSNRRVVQVLEAANRSIRENKSVAV